MEHGEQRLVDVNVVESVVTTWSGQGFGCWVFVAPSIDNPKGAEPRTTFSLSSIMAIVECGRIKRGIHGEIEIAANDVNAVVFEVPWQTGEEVGAEIVFNRRVHIMEVHGVIAPSCCDKEVAVRHVMSVQRFELGESWHGFVEEGCYTFTAVWVWTVHGRAVIIYEDVVLLVSHVVGNVVP